MIGMLDDQYLEYTDNVNYYSPLSRRHTELDLQVPENNVDIWFDLGNTLKGARRRDLLPSSTAQWPPNHGTLLK
jgi:hypothetical protein